MKKLIYILTPILLFSCSKETTEQTTTLTPQAKVISSVTSYHVNNNYNRKLTIQYQADTTVFKRILVAEIGTELYNERLLNTNGTVTFIDHYSCLCDTYYSIFFVAANGARTLVATELTKP